VPKRKKDDRFERIAIYILVSFAFLFLYGFIAGYVQVTFEDTIYIFNLPFSIQYFIFGLIVMLISIFVVLLFPKIKKVKEV